MVNKDEYFEPPCKSAVSELLRAVRQLSETCALCTEHRRDAIVTDDTTAMTFGIRFGNDICDRLLAYVLYIILGQCAQNALTVRSPLHVGLEQIWYTQIKKIE